jgi:hypothetical protein
LEGFEGRGSANTKEPLDRLQGKVEERKQTGKLSAGQLFSGLLKYKVK